MTETVQGIERVVEYDYDALYRLIEEKFDGSSVAYAYDDVGNRLAKDDGEVREYSYDDNDRLLEELVDGVVVVSYSYDANGNTKSRTENGVTTNYIWDDRNRLIEVQTSDGGTVAYEYDENNIRVSSTVDGVTTSYLLDSNRPYAQVLAEYTDGVLGTDYVYGWDLISQERDGDESFYLVDGLGSTRVLTDENGVVSDSYTYDAFGNLIGSTGSTQNDYLFAGEQFDERLGQYYLRDRYYDQDIGRFTRRDVYEGRRGEPITLNKYVYANANPVSYVDPSGLLSLAMEQSLVNTILSILVTLYYQTPLGVGRGLGSQQAISDFLESFGVFTSSTDGDGAIEKLKEGAVPKEQKKKSEKSKEYEKEGDFGTADEDFDEVAEEFGVTEDIKELEGDKRVVRLPDGSHVMVRPNSTEGSATIQVDKPGTRKHTKFRYRRSQ